MRETGRVIKIEREKILIELDPALACGDCAGGTENSAAGGCSCALFTTPKTRTLEALNKRYFDLRVGDRVAISVNSKKAMWAAFLLFILPLIVFGVGYALAGVLVPDLIEGGKVLSGGAGFAAVYLALFLLRLARKQKDWPEVVEKYSPHAPVAQTEESPTPVL